MIGPAGLFPAHKGAAPGLRGRGRRTVGFKGPRLRRDSSAVADVSPRLRPPRRRRSPRPGSRPDPRPALLDPRPKRSPGAPRTPGTMKEEPPTQRTPPASPTAPLSPQPPREDSGPPALWIFGYGSLVWRPDFAYSDSRVGFVRGYSRRFWQGDTFHRGSDKMPGRVVTLLEDHEGCTWGVAYEVRGEQISEALKYLDVREAVLGGYDTKVVTFYPQDAPDQPLRALAYVATPQNPGYLGPAPEEDIATQILACSGRSGHNLEYLLRLADFIRLCGPQAQDEHLAAIVDAVGALLPCYCPSGQTLAMA